MNKLYEYYLQHVIYSNSAYDRNIISVKKSDKCNIMSEFIIGDPFTREQFEELIKTNEYFKTKWGTLR